MSGINYILRTFSLERQELQKWDPEAGGIFSFGDNVRHGQIVVYISKRRLSSVSYSYQPIQLIYGEESLLKGPIYICF